MAEVLLGTISSVAGITSLAVQAADGLNKLRKFCINVKDAPKEIKHILRQLDVLSMQVNEILTAEESGYGPLTGNASLGSTLSLCEQSVSEVLTIVLQLEAAIERSRTWGSIKKVLKNDQIKELNGRLERAILLLNLSCTINGYKSISRSMLRIEDVVSESNREQVSKAFPAVKDDLDISQNMSPTSPQRDIPHGQLSSNAWYLKTTRDKEIQQRRKHSRKRVIQIRLPQVLIGQMWEFRSSQSIAGWDFGFRLYNVIPWDSPLFKLSEALDAEGVNLLFETGQASPYDVDPFGRTAFARAAMKMRPLSGPLEVYQFWTRLGLEVNHYGLYCMAGRLKNTEKSLCARYATLITQLDSDDFEVGAHLFYRPWMPCDIYRSIESHFDLFMEPLSRRLERIFDTWFPDQFLCKAPIEAFRARVGCDITDRNLMQIVFSNAKTLLATMISILGHACATDREQARLRLHQYLCSSLRHRIDLSSIYHSYRLVPTTLMGHFVDGYARAASCSSHGWFDRYMLFTSECRQPMNAYVQRLREAMHEWLTSLVEAGFDLTVTGREERKQMKTFDIHAYEPPEECHCRRGLGVCKVLDFQYGALPEDWRMQVSWRLDQALVWEYISGEFWQSFERPKSTMPGEWREEWDENALNQIARWRALHPVPFAKNLHRITYHPEVGGSSGPELWQQKKQKAVTCQAFLED